MNGIPSLKKFEYNDLTDSYEKRIIINNKVYRIIVLNKTWNSKSRQQIQYWFKIHNDPINNVFPYGVIQHENNVNATDVINNSCEHCGRKMKSLKNKRNHMKQCKHKDILHKIHAQTLQNNRETHGVTNKNITKNITNNITINNTVVQLCDFGKENQKWLTKDLLQLLYLDRKDAVKKLIKSKHFNEEFPENQNIRLDNKNNLNKRLQVYSRGKWRVRETRPVLNDTFFDMCDIVSDVFTIDEPLEDDDHHTEVIKRFQSTPKFQSLYNRLQDKWDSFNDVVKSDSKEFQEYWEYIKTLLLNKKLIEDQ